MESPQFSLYTSGIGVMVLLLSVNFAGAGLIIGPLIGVTYFGWLPLIIWIVIGSKFIGIVLVLIVVEFGKVTARTLVPKTSIN